MTKATKTEQAEAIKSLRKILKPGQTIYTTVMHVSRSGMSRTISMYIPVIEADGRGKRRMAIRGIDSLAAKALGWRWKGGLILDGCGMDMCFHAVYELSDKLFPKGGIDAHSGKPTTSGGYVLRKESL